jgi:hypothetical protein
MTPWENVTRFRVARCRNGPNNRWIGPLAEDENPLTARDRIASGNVLSTGW